MKSLLSILAFVFSFSLYAQDASKTITNTGKTAAQILHEVKAGKAVLLDVRTPGEFKKSHLEYASNISYDTTNFKQQVKTIDKQKTYYLYSNSGKRSGKASHALQDSGFKNAFDIGGSIELSRMGFLIITDK